MKMKVFEGPRGAREAPRGGLSPSGVGRSGPEWPPEWAGVAAGVAAGSWMIRFSIIFDSIMFEARKVIFEALGINF